jgi:hypothetical protein
MDHPPFHHEPTCSVPDCGRPALYKVAAPWSSGTSRELKNYGLACTDHRAEVLDGARARRSSLKPAEGESVGEVSLYQLMPGVRDRELSQMPDGGM